MPENSEGQAACRLTRLADLTRSRLYVLVIIVAFLCFAASATCLVVILIWFCPNCAFQSSLLVFINGVGAILLFVIGLCGLWLVIFRKRPQHTTTAQVVISEIPAEDVEKSPAPILPYNHITHHQPEASSIDLPDYFATVQSSSDIFEVDASSENLPDYFTTVHSIDEGYSSVEVGLSTDDVPNSPPPCYEQALGMTATEIMWTSDSSSAI